MLGAGSLAVAKDYAGETFVVYSYGGSWDDAIWEGAVKPLQERYPKLEIILSPSGGFSKVLAEKDDPQADVSFIDDSTMPQAIALKLIAELDTSKISNWDDVYPVGKKYGKYGAAMEFGRFGLCYRTDKIDRPTSWGDLWNPDYKSHVSIGAASAAGTAWVQFLVAAAEQGGGGLNNIAPGFEKLKEIKPNLLTVTESTGQINQLLTDGDLWLTHFWDGRCIQLKRMGVPVDFIAPKEGAFATITYIAMINGTKHPDLAHEFIDLVLSEEGQTVWTKYIGYGPTNKNVKLDQNYIDQGVLYGKEQVDAMYILPWVELLPKRPEWIEEWNDILQ
jgi:putative spermidine/putrescine transport system substrate-binding protein